LPNITYCGTIFLLIVKNAANLSWPIIGNKPVVDYLQKIVKEDRLHHAYIFNGLAGLGKYTVASFFVNSILCQHNHKRAGDNPSNIPCGRCDDCQRFSFGSHPDVYQVTRRDDKKDITIEQIQELRYNLKMSSFYNSYKFGLIDQAELLNQSSVNALLKTLEEPTSNTMLILVTSNLNKLPKTVISRCQVLNWQVVSRKELEQGLLEKGIARELVYELSHLALGRPGLALSYQQDPDLLEAYRNKIDELMNIRSSQIDVRLNFSQSYLGTTKDFGEQIKRCQDFINHWELLLRDIILARINSGNLITNYFLKEKLDLIAQKYSLNQLLTELSNLNLARYQLNLNLNPKLVIENFLIN